MPPKPPTLQNSATSEHSAACGFECAAATSLGLGGSCLDALDHLLDDNVDGEL